MSKSNFLQKKVKHFLLPPPLICDMTTDHGYPSLQAASKVPGGVAVLAVLYQVGNYQVNAALQCNAVHHCVL